MRYRFLCDVKRSHGRRWPVCENVPKLGEIPPEISLKSGESVEVVFDSAVADVGVIHGERGTSYAFPVTLNDGRRAILKGGKRLLNGVQEAIGTHNGQVRLKVTAIGQQGTLGRDWTVVKVG